MFWHIVLCFLNLVLCGFICYSCLVCGPCFLGFCFLWCLPFNISKALFPLTRTNSQSQEGSNLLHTQPSALPAPSMAQSLWILADGLSSVFFFIKSWILRSVSGNRCFDFRFIFTTRLLHLSLERTRWIWALFPQFQGRSPSRLSRGLFRHWDCDVLVSSS